VYKSLFKQTAIYGLATVLPRVFSFLLVPLYVSPGVLDKAGYGEVTVIFSYIMFFNVLLSYGMETAFFRFYNKEDSKADVISTSTISLLWSSVIFLAGALLFRNTLARAIDVQAEYVTYAIWILVLDALVVIPFARLRAKQRPVLYSVVKIGNVLINLLLNVFFLLILPNLAKPDTLWAELYDPDFKIGYIFVSNLIASLLTLLFFLPGYLRMHWHFDKTLWNKMIAYGMPILVAGIAFAVNEHFDKILLAEILPENVAKEQVGAYSACYKLGLFMVLYATAFRLGIEPFFFSHASHENAKQTYANITKYFVIFGSFILLGVIVFADIIKQFMLPNPEFWGAMKVVPFIILANFFLGIYNNLSVWYKLTDKTKMGAYISIVGAILTLVLNFTLIPLFQRTGGDGYMGSAIATLAAYGAMMFISWYLGNKYYPVPYDLRKIFAYLGLSVVLSSVYFYGFRENYFIGIPLIGVFMAFIYYSEKATVLRIISRKKTS
jgi:O-antigen/teichoic acid export membrane protein